MFNRIEEKVDFWKQRARKLKLETFALYLAYRHPQTPWYAKIFVGVVVAYAFSPIDLVPDFIPVLGYLDDLILVSLGVTLALKMIPNNVMIECRKWAQVKMREGEPVNWIMVLVILSIWVGLVALSIVWLINLCK
jgi:uncharacterized membrane protein YkvA (DUF1232 family)